MKYDNVNINPNNYFEIRDMVLYNYLDLVQNNTKIKFKMFPLIISLKNCNDFFDSECLKKLLLCSEVNEHPKRVIVDFCEMECYEILDILDKLESFYNEGKLDNIEFRFKYNQYTDNKNATVGTVSTDFCLIKDTVEAVDMITNYIKHFNLTEFERIMFLYDLVKERSYEEHIFSTLGIDKSKDKVLSEVLFNESIVCIGYSNIITAVLRNLGIDASICNIPSMVSKEDAHSVVIVNINDEKYNCYNKKLFFDVTRDCNQFDENWENKYDGFGLSSNQVSYLEKGIYKFDCNELKENVDNIGLNREILKELIANTRYIEHSIDADKYGDLLSGDLYDLNNDNYLDYEREADARLLSSLRALLSLKKSQNLNEDSYDILKEFIEENPEYIDLLNVILKNLTVFKSNIDFVDYTKNPVIPENIRNNKR